LLPLDDISLEPLKFEAQFAQIVPIAWRSDLMLPESEGDMQQQDYYEIETMNPNVAMT
jgi:hypothetical protein